MFPLLEEGFSERVSKDVFTLNNVRRAAFTLAEVLITLGIIGVVAALTMPTLITNHQKKVTAKRLAQAYSIVSNTYQRAKVDYSDPENWDTPTQDIQNSTITYVDKYFLPYLSAPKTSGWQTYQNYYGVENSSSASDATYGGYFVELKNGTLLVFYFGSKTGTDGTLIPTELNVNVDINNLQGPNRPGKDRFTFIISNNRVIASGETVQNTHDRTRLLELCKSTYPLQACSKLIMMDGWEIKDDYPWKSL